MKIIFANWKNNPSSVEEAVKLAKATDNENLVIFPPFKFLAEVARVLKKSPLGAQDFSEGLTELGVRYVIVGHSDRRKAGDTNDIVAKKFSDAINAGLIPILCVGETLEQKQQGLKEQIIREEIISAFNQLQVTSYKLQVVYIAYEPIWAISANPNAEPDKPENTLEVIKFIKKVLQRESSIHFIYGGSVTSKNAETFLRHPEIEGALVGKASLSPEEINKIVALLR